MEQEINIILMEEKEWVKAYAVHWIDDELTWLRMLKDRNETSHIYDEEMALRIYKNIKTYYPVMDSTYKKLYQRFGN